MNVKDEIKATFHFIDGSTKQIMLKCEKGKSDEFLRALADGFSTHDLLTFIEDEFTDTKIFIMKKDIVYIEFQEFKKS